MIDLASSISLFGLLAVLAALYGVRVLHSGRARHPRIDREGGGPLVGRRSMEMVYWSLSPIARGLAAIGVRAAHVSWSCLALGLFSAVAIAGGHFGVGCLLAAVGFLGDALDGMIARQTGSASDAGELLDAAIDRYVEMLVFGGVVVVFRGSVGLIVLTLVALGASVMVSYATAKAEALGVDAPRGVMRRTERATLVTLALGLSPIVERLAPGAGHAPLVVALLVVGVLGNVSAASRMVAVGRALCERRMAAG